LKTEEIGSVPIGKSISNCKVVLLGDEAKPYEGEICVSGLCLSQGYMHSSIESEGYVKLHNNSLCNHLTNDCGSQLYYRTGDYGRQLSSGDLIFIGRRDRTVKLNGKRMALEEIETTLELNPDIAEAVVLLSRDETELASLKAFVVLNKESNSSDGIIFSIRNWMGGKLPPVMIPNHFVLVEKLPLTSSGKVDYEALARLKCPTTGAQDMMQSNGTNSLLQNIKKVRQFPCCAYTRFVFLLTSPLWYLIVSFSLDHILGNEIFDNLFWVTFGRLPFWVGVIVRTGN